MPTTAVKAVIFPRGGQSYNPSIKDHKSLLKELAFQEEKEVEKNLKNLQKLQPFTYGASNIQVTGQPDSDKELYDSEVDSSEEDIDIDKNPSVNKPVDRLDIKSQAQRNKESKNATIMRQIKDLKYKKKLEKDIDQLDKIVQKVSDEAKHKARQLAKVNKEKSNEMNRQQHEGVVGKAKHIGRFKYKQRKHDFLLQDELAGNLRSMRPIGVDVLV